MPGTIHVFDFLSEAPKELEVPIIVLAGDENFLRTQALHLFLQQAKIDDTCPPGRFDGKSAGWRDVKDELLTVSLFGGGGRRIAIVEDADEFVTAHRDKLEDTLGKASNNWTLILLVNTWPSNTNLYKLAQKIGWNIICKPPMLETGKAIDEGRIVKWLVDHASQNHKFRLAKAAAVEMYQLIGANFGMLENSLAKLALFEEGKGEVGVDQIHSLVGGWKQKTMWDIVDAAVDGNTAEAIRQLDFLFQSEESGPALFGQIGWSLRRYAMATEIFLRDHSHNPRNGLGEAILAAGFRDWPKGTVKRVEERLKQLGRERAGELHRWLIEIDLALKGSHSSADRSRFILELLFAKMAKKEFLTSKVS